jgi:hypothetical protein
MDYSFIEWGSLLRRSEYSDWFSKDYNSEETEKMRCHQSIGFFELSLGGGMRTFFSTIFILFLLLPSWGQENPKHPEVKVSFDTISLKKGTWFKYKERTYKILKDTIFVIKSTEPSAGNSKSATRSKTFYDSVYKKFSRRKFSRLLYGLAFKPNDIQPLPGNSHKIKSEVPFKQFEGKVIRHIHIETLDPFGTSIYDTLANIQTSIGKTLNAMHVKTRSWVIRENLFIKEGQKVDPFVLADNERNIREMSSIDDVKTYVTILYPSADSVDVTIVTKDVFSIGVAVLTATTSSLAVRLYDGNFLGLNNKLTTSFSIKTKRQTFFQIDGASYSWDNIAGSFLGASVFYNQDDLGDQSLGISCNRPFYSIKTKWSFGAGYQYNKMEVEKQNPENGNEIISEISYYSDINLWGGRSFQIRSPTIPMRFVIAESLFRRSFASRPRFSIDSNKIYYNTNRFLTAFAFSANNYYLSDYILHFGKPEIIPYGRVFKITLGPEITDYYTRLYGSVDLSAGDFINGFGYFSGRAVLGGYLYHKSTEDCVLKLSLKYMSPLFVTRDKKFKFRNFLSSDYRYGFNSRENNLDYTNINNDFLINHVKLDSVFYGIKSLSAALSVIMYTPIYFYGFRFAFMLQGKGGLVAPAGNLFHKPLWTGVGVAILIGNDNLIFPPLLISCFYYPSVPHGVTWWQLGFNQNTGITLPEYNVTMPRTETLQN